MQIISCTGDSHTWGQGGRDVRRTYEGWGRYSVVGGEHRMVPFANGAYVNLLAERVNARTGSSRTDYEARVLADAYGLVPAENCVIAGGLRLPFDGALLRLQFFLPPWHAPAEIRVDGNVFWEGDFYRKDRKNPYNLLTFRLDDGPHVLELSGKAAMLYRIEIYRGPWAVVNCGVGSCPAGRYLNEYYDAYVAPLSPAVVIAQGHTINDWLTDETPADYEQLLAALLGRMKAGGAETHLLTVEPILGRQLSRSGDAFADYIAASRRAAAQAGVPILDAHAALSPQLAALPDDEARFSAWYEDNWHPNAAGHALYARVAWEGIQGLMNTEALRLKK